MTKVLFDFKLVYMAILAIFLHYKHQKLYKGTLGTQELPHQGPRPAMVLHWAPTGSFKWTLGFSGFCMAVFTFSKKYIL